MNRALLITIGSLTLVLALGIWIFLLIFGTPQSANDVFTDLGIIQGSSGGGEVVYEEPPLTEELTRLSISLEPLQMLTTLPVAGFAIATSGEDTIVRFVEKGTGHVYDINLESGVQVLISGTTVPRTTEAYFAPDLMSFVTVSDVGERQISLWQFVENEALSITRTALFSDAYDFTFIDNTTLHYARSNNVQTYGYVYDLTRQEERQVYRVDIPGLSSYYHDGDWYVAPKPTQYLIGALYRVENGNRLTPMSKTVLGFIPFFSEAGIITNRLTDGYYSSLLTDGITEQMFLQPEKCVSLDVENIWCGADALYPEASYLEDWYKGTVVNDDSLLRIRLNDVSVKTLIVPSTAIGQTLDMVNLQFTPQKDFLIFKNRTDSMLWIYRNQ